MRRRQVMLAEKMLRSICKKIIKAIYKSENKWYTIIVKVTG